jgi:hypothetical protein
VHLCRAVDPKIKSSLASKFRWAFTDKAKFKTLLTDLRDLNDGLHSLLRLAEFSVVNSATQSRALRATNDLSAIQHSYLRCVSRRKDDFACDSTSGQHISATVPWSKCEITGYRTESGGYCTARNFSTQRLHSLTTCACVVGP